MAGYSQPQTWILPEYASVLAHDKIDMNIIWMVTDKSFGKFDLFKSSYHPVLDLNLEPSFRANDGGVSPDGTFWFGTMQWEPSEISGSVYSISAKAELWKQPVKMGIPNTFCWNTKGTVLYISDSFQQKIFSIEVKNQILDGKTARVFVDLSNGNSTPDGGAFNLDGFLWNAHWDGHKVVKYGPYGEFQNEISMPVPKPSSCCFGGPENRHLFVTSARTTMSKNDIARYPMSGNVFVKELKTVGRPSIPFYLDI